MSICEKGPVRIHFEEKGSGAAAVSGAPGGEKDEACVQTGLAKVRDQLN